MMTKLSHRGDSAEFVGCAGQLVTGCPACAAHFGVPVLEVRYDLTESTLTCGAGFDELAVADWAAVRRLWGRTLDTSRADVAWYQDWYAGSKAQADGGLFFVGTDD